MESACGIGSVLSRGRRQLGALRRAAAWGLACFCALSSHEAQAASADAATKCAALLNMAIPTRQIGLPSGGAKIVLADWVSAGPLNPSGEYCLIHGEIAPVHAKAQVIRFTAALPSHWNGKVAQYSSQGFGGEVPAPDTAWLLSGTRSLIARGYVAFGSDNGHSTQNSLDASFALEEEELRNFAGEQLKKTHDAMLLLIKTRYDTAPTHSYFMGGSEGGREAFAVIQDYPGDYDGVIALLPGHAFVADFLKFQVIRRAAQLHQGAGHLSQAKVALLHKAELEACDILDGLEDSIIGNVDGCQIDFRTLRCPAGIDSGPDCLSDAQLATVQTLYTETPISYRLSDGRTSLPAYPIGAEWGRPPSPVADARDPAPGNQQAADIFLRYFVLREAQANTLEFDPVRPGKYLRRLRDLSVLLDKTSTAIDAYIARGGKLILLQGRADQGAPPSTTIDYYQKLVARYGQTQTDKFLRFYLVPGYGHGVGTFNARGAPTLDALEDWVERGIAPGTLTAVDANPEGHGRSRPICVYPTWPKYAGSGDPGLASSFNCSLN